MRHTAQSIQFTLSDKIVTTKIKTIISSKLAKFYIIKPVYYLQYIYNILESLANQRREKSCLDASYY